MKGLFKNEKVDIKNLNEMIKSGSKILRLLFFLLVIVGVYAVTLIFKEWQILWFILLIFKILSPFFIGIIIAWLLDPCVQFLYKKGISKVLGTILVYIVMLILLYLALTGIFPLLLNQINDFITTLPSIFDDITLWTNNFVDRFKDISFIDVEIVKADLVNSINGFVGSLTNDMPTMIVNFFRGLVSTVGIFALGLMIGFYLLFDFDNIGRVLLSFLPARARKDAISLFMEANDSLFNYIKGTIFVSLIIFAVSAVVFTVTGLKAPLLFALICGITNVIPYIGPYLGAVPATIVAFTQGVPTGIIVLISIIITQFIEGNFIQPLVMSKTMKLHPVTILIGLLVFGYFFGVLGMIIATPLVAVIKSIILFVENKYNILKFKQETE
ncbi:MAG: AI-2E family transporter [Bacilli bacterium]|nr:AI-2E family transporter [Bacilli bacterium]MDD4298546.1 AI-2E family transporter [Bacilli bacterium]MDD4643739.1 AI-2E family transporter [Bacilli bacterium]